MSPITIPRNIHHVVNYWVADAPVVSVDLGIIFSAKGSVSVNNPVHVHVTLTNANVSNLLQYYNGLSFTDAYSTTVCQNDRPTPDLVKIPITPSSLNEYEADGTIVWLLEGPTWPFLVLNTSTNLMINAVHVQSGDAAIVVASVSDTLSVRNTAIETALTFVLVGFSVLMLQPILEALSLKSPPSHQESSKAEPQRAPQQSPQETKPQPTASPTKLLQDKKSRNQIQTTDKNES